jgi:hypothetical protein
MGPYELLLPFLSLFMQLFSFTKESVVVAPCFVGRYFKQFVVYVVCLHV